MQLAALTAAATTIPLTAQPADFSLDIAPFTVEPSPRHRYKTVAYNGSVPGPLLRLKEGRQVTIEVHNRSSDEQVVHWHGLFVPSAVDGAMEEGTPPIPPGGTARYTFTPRPAGTRWYHTHVRADNDLSRGLYSGMFGFLLIEPSVNAGGYDQEAFLALHDMGGQLLASDDGSMNPAYDVSTINGHAMGYGEPLRVRSGQRLLLRILNASPTEVHWIAFGGHRMQVVALDGNDLPQQKSVSMLRLVPAERADVLVELNNPGVWTLGEVRRHVQAAGMAMVVEYAGQAGKPQWQQPEQLLWDYTWFAGATTEGAPEAIEVPLVFTSKFAGHGALDHWAINGKSFPHTDSPIFTAGKRYRLLFRNRSTDDHPVHLHRHTFEVVRIAGGPRLHGLMKDTILVMAGTDVDVELIANHPGPTLFHCHQQDHMDMGFMMLFRYA
ncbi:MAG TPA: multicopper oxidase family protein [Acidobacteriaceae bacterium]|jgi:FtsP/CotA-like multicopper oxidase with cupredoxin domain